MIKEIKKLKKKLGKNFFIGWAIILALLLGWYVSENWAPAIHLKGKLFASFSRRSEVLGGNVYRLPVAFHRQEHSLSCEIAALKMALNGVGINPSEQELIDRLAFDETVKSKGVWGDPYTGFVGKINGKMGITGYGVYWEPIRDVASNYTYAEVLENATPQDLTAQLLEGRPIVWWGYFGRGRKLTWQTPEGKQINAVNGEHARTIIGFTGEANNPTGFILLDPIYGELYWDTEKLMNNSGSFNNSGVVVYPHDRLFFSKH